MSNVNLKDLPKEDDPKHRKKTEKEKKNSSSKD